MTDKIQLYQNILLKWQKSLNLVASTNGEFFKRHISDSLQLKKFLTTGEILIDLGSGAGLPGIPLSIISNIRSYLIESDRKKAIFLTEAVRELKLNTIIINQRIEKVILNELKAQSVIITARALAELGQLLKLIQSFLENNEITDYKLILPKGSKVLSEIENAKKHWVFDHSLEKSETDETASILIINRFEPKHDS